ncbi:MAG: hypothetical protein DBX46_01935 [Clostridiales bacterium]|nr:MAG: hypothetical protein DBX46_01935 [Clostridiales bacterium]
MRGFENLKSKEFDLEAFMVSITYPPAGMTMNLARKLVTAECPGLGNLERETAILRRALEMLPVGINDTDVIAGNYGPKFADPELLEAIKKADEEEFSGSAEYKVRDEEERLVSGRYMLFGIYTPSHTCVDYETLITKGLNHYKERIEKRLAENIDKYATEYLNAMLYSIETVAIYAGRFRKLAEQKLKESEDKTQMENLARMADALSRVPMEPARDLFEALQSIWMMHTAIPTSERSWASVSLGRMDMYLMPYYERWLEEGHTEQEAVDLMSEFFKTFDAYGDGSCALNIGPDFNAMSEVLLKVEKSVKLRSPIIAVRMESSTPDEIYDKYIDKELFDIGQPTFYGEEACRAAMEYRGMAPEEGHSVNSCMGMVVVGKELADMWGCCVNMNLPLELAVNNGRPILGEFPPSLRRFTDRVTPEPPTDFEAVKRNYAGYIRAVVQYVVNENRKRSAWVSVNRPNPLLSMMLDDCIRYGRDRAHASFKALGEEARQLFDGTEDEFNAMRQGRGVRYHNVTVLSMGFAHAADALACMKQLVFEQKKYTLNDLMNAAADNYESPRSAQIGADMRSCAKYADGSGEADKYAAYVLNALADACEACYDGNIRYLPTCHTIDANVQFGNCVYASMDSRRAGEPFGKNAGAVMYAIKNTPTDLCVSSAGLPCERFSGGMPIDIYVPENILSSKENRDKFRGLLRTYFDMGGMQVQVNSVSIDLLKKAYEEPENYPHVIVRKGGFSIYFTDMLREVQKDMIDRFEMESR